jgi:hypothetical protein
MSTYFWREGCEVIEAWVQDALNRPAGGNIGWWGGWTSVCRPFLGFELYVREAGGRPRVAEDALTEELAFLSSRSVGGRGGAELRGGWTSCGRAANSSVAVFSRRSRPHPGGNSIDAMFRRFAR